MGGIGAAPSGHADSAWPQIRKRASGRLVSRLATKLHKVAASRTQVYSDPIGTSVLKRLRKKKEKAEKEAAARGHASEGSSEEGGGAAWWRDVPNRVWVVYSGELQQVVVAAAAI